MMAEDRPRQNLPQQEPPMNTTLFWDIDKNKLDFEKHKRFIIERILQYGLPNDIKWLLNKYAEKDIIKVVKQSKNIDKKTANFWAIHFEISKKEVLCLNRPLIQELFY